MDKNHLLQMAVPNLKKNQKRGKSNSLHAIELQGINIK
jgi:hypothetical protein